MTLAARTIRIESPDYPASLHRLRDAPELLVVEGSLAGLERSVGIVGTRRATPAALAVTRAMARELAEHDVIVVSGGAEGIDRAAHEGALEAPGGRTVAVLPTALHAPYPRRHASLFERIATRGARLTEHPSATAIHRSHFLGRNRIIAALVRVVVVVQAPQRSGALRTALDAEQLGLPLRVVPWSPLEVAAEGSNALLARGVVACRHAADVLLALGDRPPKTSGPRARQLQLQDPDAAALLAVLEDVACDRETVLARSGLPVARAQAALASLVIEGAAHEDALGVRRA